MNEEPLSRIANLSANFATRYGAAPQVIAFAPGRVNLIGEHIDYNGGVVLPFAIEMGTHVAVRWRSDRQLWAWSDWAGESCNGLVIDELTPRTVQSGWARYVSGAVAQFARRGLLRQGLELIIETNLPIGAGLSSSASLTTAITLAVAQLAEITLVPWEAARWCQAAEHEFAGVPCGLMDPLAILQGRRGHALKIDFQADTTTAIPLELEEYQLILIHSGVHHSLAAGQYAERRADCAEAARILEVATLRQLVSADEHRIAKLPERLQRRVAHVVSEIERVQQAESCCRQRDWRGLGTLLTASHRSLANDYEVSCPEIDQLVELLIEQPSTLGARMTGGGFGGCVIALVAVDAWAAVAEHVQFEYARQTGRRAEVWSIAPSAGAWARQEPPIAIQ